MKKILIFLVFTLLIPFTKSEAQTTPCPPTYGSWEEDLETAWFVTESGNQYQWGGVQYKKNQASPNRWEIKAKWSTLHRNTLRYGLTDEEFEILMYKAIIKDIEGTTNDEPCSFTGTREYAFYEEVPCKTNIVCYYRLKQEGSILCTDPGFGPPPEFQQGSDGWNYYGRLTEVVDCNEMSCCEIVYTVECLNGDIHITDISRSIITECVSTHYNCWYETDEPCESKCK